MHWAVSWGKPFRDPSIEVGPEVGPVPESPGGRDKGCICPVRRERGNRQPGGWCPQPSKDSCPVGKLRYRRTAVVQAVYNFPWTQPPLQTLTRTGNDDPTEGSADLRGAPALVRTLGWQVRAGAGSGGPKGPVKRITRRGVLTIGAAFRSHSRERGVGGAGVEIGCRLQQYPDIDRGPDVPYRVRVPRNTGTRSRGFVASAPDVAVEESRPWIERVGRVI